MSAVYFLQRADGAIKIGYTADYAARLKHLTRKHGELTLLGTSEGNFLVESGLHQRFSEYRIGNTEFFVPGDKLMTFIKESCTPPSFVPKKVSGWRFRLIELRSQKEIQEKRRITNKEIAQAARVSTSVVDRWMAEPVVELIARHVQRLADYFGVQWDEVIELVDKDQS